MNIEDIHKTIDQMQADIPSAGVFQLERCKDIIEKAIEFSKRRQAEWDAILKRLDSLKDQLELKLK